MNLTTFLNNFWELTAKHDGVALRDYFHPDVKMYVHDLNRLYNLESWLNEILKGKEELKGEWKITVDRVEKLENGQVVTITFHRSEDWVGFATSFFTFKDNKIIELHEYYSQCEEIPQWRTDLSEHEKIK